MVSLSDYALERQWRGKAGERESQNALLLHGDALERLRTIEADSIDSLVTDPPAGIGFMGKEWDTYGGGARKKPDHVTGLAARYPQNGKSGTSIAERTAFLDAMTPIFKECLRVLKPGAHGLVWALPRTSHWTATALEDAGFEVRDVCVHLFGSGFPKSLDVSKALDKAAGAERQQGPMKRGGERLSRLQDGNRDGEGTWGNEVNRQAYTSLPATDEAKRWSGWGTALKPAAENWILIRKPLSEKTVASNVLRHGTGALNIDASRIAHASAEDRAKHEDMVSRIKERGGSMDGSWKNSSDLSGANDVAPNGRWPANVLLSHSESCKLVGTTTVKGDSREPQDGTRDGGFYDVGSEGGDGKPCGPLYGEETVEVFECTPDCPVAELDRQSGGASRFFYVAKPSKREKNAGCDTNNHPTVKAVALMKYLCTMITPPAGTVLDPFVGSGSTGVAAVQCGFRFVGIEQSDEYLNIASARIAHSQAA